MSECRPSDSDYFTHLAALVVRSAPLHLIADAVHYAAVLSGHITGPARPSVRLSVFPIWAPNSEKGMQKIRDRRESSLRRSKRCAIFSV